VYFLSYFDDDHQVGARPTTDKPVTSASTSGAELVCSWTNEEEEEGMSVRDTTATQGCALRHTTLLAASYSHRSGMLAYPRCGSRCFAKTDPTDTVAVLAVSLAASPSGDLV
jgi:hypothetical protein